jgi:hypothetical protein
LAVAHRGERSYRKSFSVTPSCCKVGKSLRFSLTSCGGNSNWKRGTNICTSIGLPRRCELSRRQWNCIASCLRPSRKNSRAEFDRFEVDWPVSVLSQSTTPFSAPFLRAGWPSWACPPLLTLSLNFFTPFAKSHSSETFIRSFVFHCKLILTDQNNHEPNT